MQLTSRQRTRIRQLYAQGYLPERIAIDLGIELSKVRPACVRGAPRGRRTQYTPEQKEARRELSAALNRRSISARHKAVRCVLANFGPLLDKTLEDAPKVIEEFLAKKAG